MADQDIVHLNIGGIRYDTTYSTLASMPGSKLDTLGYVDKWSEDKQQEIFIDRDGRHFVYILNYLRNCSNALLPKDVVVLEELRLEAHFYQLPELVKIVEDKIEAEGNKEKITLSVSVHVGYQWSMRVLVLLMIFYILYLVFTKMTSIVLEQYFLG